MNKKKYDDTSEGEGGKQIRASLIKLSPTFIIHGSLFSHNYSPVSPLQFLPVVSECFGLGQAGGTHGKMVKNWHLSPACLLVLTFLSACGGAMDC